VGRARDPSVAYTDPEVAWVGLTETEAKKAGVAVETAKFPGPPPAARRAGPQRRLHQAGVRRDTHRVVGGGIVGVRAGELIARSRWRSRWAASRRPRPHHPSASTLSESVGMAAEVFEGSITDLYIPRR
jgi:dihydrolipoamide dehydrogenase